MADVIRDPDGGVYISSSAEPAENPHTVSLPPLPSDAAEYQRENFEAYTNKSHPQHAKVVREVRARFAREHPAPVRTQATPELQAAADQPISRPPSLGPNDPRAQVPASGDQYEVTFPHAPEGSAPYAPAALVHVKTVGHRLGLSHHQLQAVINKGFGMAATAGPAELREEQLADLVSFGKGIGLNQKQTTALLDLFEELAPRASKPAAQAEAERLMQGRAYWDATAAGHLEARAKVRALFDQTPTDPRR